MPLSAIASRPPETKYGRPALPAIYVINLDSSPERYTSFRKSINSNAPIIRVRARSGAEISARDYHRLVNKAPCLFYHCRLLTRNELGCCVSHLNAIDMFLSTADDIVLIAEDDMTIDQMRLTQLIESIGDLPAGWEMIKLSYVRRLFPVSVGRPKPGIDLSVFFDIATSSGAYMLNRTGAEKLKKTLQSFTGPIDHCFDRTWQTGLHVYGVWPPIAEHRTDVKSDIDNPSCGGDTPRPGKPLMWPLWWLFVQPVVRAYYLSRKYRHVSRYCGRKPDSFLFRLGLRRYWN